MKTIKRIIAIVLVLCILGSSVNIVHAASEENEEVVFPYTNAEMYVADCLSKGMIGQDGIPLPDTEVLVSRSILYDFTFEILAEAAIDNTSLLVSSVLWQNASKMIDGAWLEMASWQTMLYETILLDYLAYTGDTEEFNDYIIEKTVQYEGEILGDLIDYAGDAYGETLETVMKTMPKTEVQTFINKYGYMDKISKYTKIVGELIDIAESKVDYYKKVAQVMAAKDVIDGRIDFLKEIRSQCDIEEDTYLYMALNMVITYMEASREDVEYHEQTLSIVNYTVEKCWDTIMDAAVGMVPAGSAPAVKNTLLAIKLGRLGLDWFFDSDDMAENNIKLVFLYIINSKAIGALQSLRDKHWNNPSIETGTDLTEGFTCYVNYIKYATGCADAIVSEICYGGGLKFIVDAVGSQSDLTYAEFKRFFSGDISICQAYERLKQRYYNLYNAFSGNKGNNFDNIDTEDSIGGQCGDTLRWIIQSDGTLYIFGKGMIPDFNEDVTSPWHQYKDKITKVVLAEGITGIGDYSFYNYDEIIDISVPASVETIGAEAFYQVTLIHNLSSATGCPWGARAVHNYPVDNCLECGTGCFELKFAGASLELKDDLSIRYMVNSALFAEGAYTSPYIMVELNGVETKITDYTVDGDYYVFRFDNIAPHQMNDKAYATIYATYDGKEYASVTRDYSVATYCYSMLERCTDDIYAEFRTLLIDLLGYGAKAQLFVGYKTDELVDANLTDAQRAWGTKTDRELVSVLDPKYETVDNPTATWRGAGLNLQESIKMRFVLAADNIDGLSVKVTCDGKEWIIPAEEFTLTSDGYEVLFDGLNAAQLSEEVYVTVYKDGATVSNTARYSVESYAWAKQSDANTKLAELVKAMMKYGDAVYNYVN